MALDRTVRSAPRMTGAEALMWAVERDPALRSTFLNITLLDRVPDVEALRQRLGTASRLIPRLRQRVRDSALPWEAPRWEEVDDFDLAEHVRHVALPAPGSWRQLLDMAAAEYSDAFDGSRPLWRFTVVEGLDNGRAALFAKMHHVVSDGVGAIRLSAMFTDVERDAPEPELPEVLTSVSVDETPSILDAVAGAGRWAAGRVARRISEPRSIQKDAIDTVETARSVSRQLLITDRARSPLWSGVRSLARRFETLSLGLDDALGAARKLGGTLNDLYVAGVAGGAGAYHRAMRSPVDELRVSMPVSTRTDRSAGGNAFAPSRVLVPAGDIAPAERLRIVHERLTSVKSERSLGFADTLAQAARGLPAPVLLRLARQQVSTVDFAASNTRGAPFDLFIAGAEVLANHPMGPTAGTAFNATLMSYRGSMDVGINIDTAAVRDPELLRDSIATSLAELVDAGS